MEKLALLLRESPLFAGLEEKEIRRLVELAQLQRFHSGAVIVAQGSAGEALYLLCEGSLKVSALGEKDRVVSLATLNEPGTFFGEVSLVDPGPRSATVKAQSEAVVLKVELTALERFFIEFADTQAIVMRNLAKVLAQRLRSTNVAISSISSSS